MSIRPDRPPSERSDAATSLLLGAAFALGLFVVMALAQMMGGVKPPQSEVTEEIVAFVPPELELIDDEPPPPPEAEEPPPELDEPPPQLSLAQLDIVLNPGTGGGLMGDFAMPTIGRSSRELGTDDFVDFSDLDQIPRPIGVSGFDFPRRLLKKKVKGQVVLLVKLNETGGVLAVEVESSNLPEFERFIEDAVQSWSFTPPTQQGRPVKAMARLPIPINIT